MFDIQGHRGCRGLFPENTIQAFIKAIQLGVSTLELDVVITKDHKVLVSHEPWMNPEICSTSDGLTVTGDGMQHNIYQMNYDEVVKFDCGIKVHPRFLSQNKIPSVKPLLVDMIDAVESFIIENNLPPIYYNIETKCNPQGDNLFHPEPELFSKLLYAVLKEKDVLSRTYVQSFDYRTLQFFKTIDSNLKLVMLLDDHKTAEVALIELGFTPQVYSPYYKTVNTELVNWCHNRNMKIIPWTINHEAEMHHLKDIGVDGIITDYPDIAIKLFR